MTPPRESNFLIDEEAKSGAQSLIADELKTPNELNHAATIRAERV
jgi:hypothetical protein